MSATTYRSQPRKSHIYPGLRSKVEKLFAEHPNKTYGFSDVLKNFSGTPETAIRYHITKLKQDKILEMPKHGFYRINNAKPPSIEQIRAEVNASIENGQATKVVQSDVPFAFGKVNGIVGIDTTVGVDDLAKRLLQREVSGILARMDSELPAKAVFTQSDREALQELVELAHQARFSTRTPATVAA